MPFLANSSIGLLSFGSDATVTAGQSAQLGYKIGGSSTSATIDNGIGTVIGSGTVTVNPTETTTYTLNVDGLEKSVTVTVLKPIEITSTGFTAPDGNGDIYFTITATNLAPGALYELFVDIGDLQSFAGTGITATADPETNATFTETLPADFVNQPRLFYRIEEVAP